MPFYRLLLEYDGSAFHGWQTQPNVRTVQGELNRALSILSRESVQTAGAGRTDCGVHARGQVVSFELAGPIEKDRLIAGIHGLCGGDLRVLRLDLAPDRFHARHDALWRAYSYRLLEHPSSLMRKLAWYPPTLPNLASLRQASEPLLGFHNLESFANTSPDNGSNESMILSLDWDCWDEGLIMTIRADRFLYKMVRNIVGTLVREASETGGGRDAVAAVLSARNRKSAAPPAPAEGLCFEAVGYDPPWPEE